MRQPRVSRLLGFAVAASFVTACSARGGPEHEPTPSELPPVLASATLAMVKEDPAAQATETAFAYLANSTASFPPTEEFTVTPEAPGEGYPFYVNPDSHLTRAVGNTEDPILKELLDIPTGIWLTAHIANPREYVDKIMENSAPTGKIPIFVLYNIPNLDMGQSPAIGAKTPEDYQNWIQLVADGLSLSHAIVVVEPDALPLSTNLPINEQAGQIEVINQAVRTLRKNTKADIYIDIGHSNWLSVDQAVQLLNQAGIDQADGFSVNVANFRSQDEVVEWANAVSKSLGGMKFIVDTSRNGVGPDPNGEYCNPPGRALGEKPGYVDDPQSPYHVMNAYIKPFYEGDCQIAGQLVLDYAKQLYNNSPFFGK